MWLMDIEVSPAVCLNSHRYDFLHDAEILAWAYLCLRCFVATHFIYKALVTLEVKG